jgi:predicted ester cyclase
MSAEDNKTVIRRYYENAGNFDLQDGLIADDRVDHAMPPGMPKGPAGHRQFLAPWYAAFPDVQFTIEQILAEGDLVATHWTVRATHTGELMGIPATGKKVMMTGTVIDRIVDGKIAESWVNNDQLGLFQQIGAVQDARAATTE